MKAMIGVIGGSESSQGVYAQAYDVGREIARRGAVLVCGGLGGVMEAACKGAQEAGGLTVGVLPGHHAEEGNPYVDVPVVTGMGYARNAVLVRTARSLIALDGSYGTLSELAFALQMGKPVVSLGCRIAPDEVVRATDPVSAVEQAMAACSKG
jgi:hypothetical protein